MYQTNVADCWLGVRLENIGALIVMFACLFAILARDTIGEAMVGLSISYAIQIAAVLSYFVMIATEVIPLFEDITHHLNFNAFLNIRWKQISWQ